MITWLLYKETLCLYCASFFQISHFHQVLV